jgi:hypothetical protein
VKLTPSYSLDRTSCGRRHHDSSRKRKELQLASKNCERSETISSFPTPLCRERRNFMLMTYIYDVASGYLGLTMVSPVIVFLTLNPINSVPKRIAKISWGDTTKLNLSAHQLKKQKHALGSEKGLVISLLGRQTAGVPLLALFSATLTPTYLQDFHGRFSLLRD